MLHVIGDSNPFYVILSKGNGKGELLEFMVTRDTPGEIRKSIACCTTCISGWTDIPLKVLDAQIEEACKEMGIKTLAIGFGGG